MLELVAVGKRLGALELSEINLELGEKEYVVLLGPSGVGKTVLLEMVAGLLRPDRGAVRWRGRDITASPPEQRGFALVYQDFALFPHLTALQNIAYGLRARGIGAGEARRRAGEVADLLAIGALMDRRPERLSGGEKQRVALARALVIDPPVLLLDEPLASLDRNVREHLRQTLRDVHREKGIAFLHVTHDVDEALCLGQRLGVLLDGRLQQTGTPEELFHRPTDRRVAEFLGLKNMLRVTRAEGDACTVDGVAIHVPDDAQTVRHLWIRPEEIVLSTQPFDSSARNQFPCHVVDWEPSGNLLAVRVSVHDLVLTAMITRASFQELGIGVGAAMFCTFKTSAVHCLRR